MSKKNKCNGLDCEMCGNAKCPNEEKEKIIDGIDVSECCFYNNGKCDNPNGMACNCINNAVCYFKELKRLQKENEGLKSLNDFNVQKIEVLQEENEGLKKKKDEYYLINLDYETKISYLIQALEEIRDIAKFNQFYNPEYLPINGDIGLIQDLKMTKIYNKINEVLNA